MYIVNLNIQYICKNCQTLQKRKGEKMTNYQKYRAVKNPLKNETLFAEHNNSEELTKEIQKRLKLIEKAFR